MSTLKIDCLLPICVIVDGDEFISDSVHQLAFLSVSNSSYVSDDDGTFFHWELRDGNVNGRRVEFSLSRDQVRQLASFLRFALEQKRESDNMP